MQITCRYLDKGHDTDIDSTWLALGHRRVVSQNILGLDLFIHFNLWLSGEDLGRPTSNSGRLEADMMMCDESLISFLFITDKAYNQNR